MNTKNGRLKDTDLDKKIESQKLRYTMQEEGFKEFWDGKGRNVFNKKRQ